MVPLIEAISEFLEEADVLLILSGLISSIIAMLISRIISEQHFARKSEEVRMKMEEEGRSRKNILFQISKRESELEQLSNEVEILKMDVERLRAIKKIRDDEVNNQANRIEELSRKIKELERENERLLELKKLNQKQVQGLIILLEEQMEKFGRKSRIENISIAAFFFFLGMFASILIF